MKNYGYTVTPVKNSLQLFENAVFAVTGKWSQSVTKRYISVTKKAARRLPQQESVVIELY